MKAAILTDLSKCIGCEACVHACQEINELPTQEHPKKLSNDVWTINEHKGKVNVRRQCMHCLEPTCVSVCPVTALQKTKEGPVIYDSSRCMGCRYCMLACPFSIPKYEWESPAPKIRKCIMCYENRIKEGKQPACTSVCPTGATKFGDRDELIKEATARIEADPSQYANHIYGLHEAGGTSVLYLSPVPFAELGFKTELSEEPYPKLTWNALSKVPNIVGVGGVLLVGIHWVINRRMMMEKLHGQNAVSSEEFTDTTSNLDNKEPEK